MTLPDYDPPEIDRPPVYASDVNRTIAAFVARRAVPCRRSKGELPSEIIGSKTSTAYRAHSYHTKVPPEGIVPFIEHFTRPGDVVLDPFCGSGMTGVAALQAGRRAVLIDLSPAATFIACNYCARPDPEQLRKEARRVLRAVSPELEPLYTTRCRQCGGPAILTYTVWSDRYACPDCRAAFALWDVAREEREVAAELCCPCCRRTGRKEKWQRLDPVPVLVKYRCCGGCGAGEAPPERADVETAHEAGAAGWEARIPFPRTPIPTRGDEIARVHNQGITRVDQLFTRRNLRAIATLWHAVVTLPDLECRGQLFFCLTGSMPRASRANKYIPALGMAPGPILGTMYIPGFHPELNVLALFERKLADAARYYEWGRHLACLSKDAGGTPAPPAVRISTQSATDLSNIPDGSIDYAFTDPPFGSNIAYSELNLLWESWLGVRTHVADEAIVSRTQKKSVDDYERMMARSFGEVRRVLRRGGRLTVVFHNTSGEVWRALQQAIDDAGLAVESVLTFDKGPNQSFKQFTAEGAVTHDLVVTCSRSLSLRERGGVRGAGSQRGAGSRGPHPTLSQRERESASREASPDDLLAFLRRALEGEQGKPNPRKLYSAAIAHFLIQGARVPVGFKEFRQLLAGLGDSG
jgi:DNA modification methylase